MPDVSERRLSESEIREFNLELISEVANYYNDPLGFVLFAYPWGDKGSLEHFSGPDDWQREFLTDLGIEVRKRAFDGNHSVDPVRMAVASGHGIGKSVLVAWLVNWITSTRPQCRGTVTANTFTQLSTRTWAAIQQWATLSITGHWFNVSGEKLYHKGFPKTWFCSAQTCKEENSEAFAGQHALNSTSFYIADEASAIPDKIFEVSEGGLTDGEPMIFLFGNPTRSEGKFFRVSFGEERDRWNHRSIDSRECQFPNKKQIEEWRNDWGEESDFFRVRVKGLPPNSSDLQFIGGDLIRAAQNREALVLPDEPLVVGVDLARGGEDWNVIRFRRGLDGTMPPIRIPGNESADSMLMVAKIADVINLYKPAKVFLDGTGGSIGGPIGDRLRSLGYKNVVDIQFSGKSPDPKYSNMRAWMWFKMREWLLKGSISKRDVHLATDLAAPSVDYDKRDRLKMVLESKESMRSRGVHSPNDADAFALTFPLPVISTIRKRRHEPAYIGPWS